MESIKIRGAKTHNLKNINVDIKIGKITCLAGPSGSGKSSLAFHTLLTESKRRFMNSFPSDVKFFWDIPNTVDVESINPVLPVWGLAQHNPVIGSRPAVIDLIGVYEKLQKIFFVLGKNSCPVHNTPFVVNAGFEDLISKIQKFSTIENDVIHFCIEKDVYKELHATGYPIRSYSEDGMTMVDFEEDSHYWEAFRIKASKVDTLAKKIKQEKLGKTGHRFLIFFKEQKESFFYEVSHHRHCSVCEETEQRAVDSLAHMSPYNALGACDTCSGHGLNLVYDRNKIIKDDSLSISEGVVSILETNRFSHLYPSLKKEFKKAGYDVDKPFSKLPQKKWKDLYEGIGTFPGLEACFEYLESKRYKKPVRIYIRGLQKEEICGNCDNTRISEDTQNIRLFFGKKSISYKEILMSNFEVLLARIQSMRGDLEADQNWHKVESLYEEVQKSLVVSNDMGLGHIELSRKVKTLTPGEYQRLLLVKYLSYEGVGSLFVLDEPSLGLGLNEQKSLMSYVNNLKKQGNTILIVDHSEYIKKTCDEIIMMGPGAGHLGGEILYQGKYKKEKSDTKDFEYFDRNKKRKWLKVDKLKVRTEDEKTYKLPINELTWVKGDSGTGKTSSLIHGVANFFLKEIGNDKISTLKSDYKNISSDTDFEDVLVFDSKIGKVSSRSTVGTYIGFSPYLRKHYAGLPVSKGLGLKDGHFSFNSDLGKCPTCEGKGLKTVDLQFIEDLQFVCEDCKGMKLKPFYATISDGRYSAYEAFTESMSSVIPHLKLTPKMKRIWALVELLNLDYLSLDRSLSSLSGGEKQRLKLLAELQKNITDSLLIFENLSFGLSSKELTKISQLLHKLLAQNNTIVLIDPNEFFTDFAHYSLEFQHKGVKNQDLI